MKNSSENKNISIFEEINIEKVFVKRIFASIKSNLLLIVMSAFLSVFTVQILDAYKTPIYAAKVTAIAVKDRTSNSSLQGLESLRSLVGLSGSQSLSNNLSKSIEVLRTFKFFETYTNFIQENTNYSKSNLLIENLWLPWSRNNLTNQELHDFFLNELLTINHDPRKETLEIILKSNDPLAAKELLDALVECLDIYIKINDVNNSKKSISFLEERIDSSTQAEIRLLLSSLLIENYKSIILSETAPNYIFELLDPPIIPEKPISNKITYFFYITLFFFTFIFLLWLFKKIIIRKVSS